MRGMRRPPLLQFVPALGLGILLLAGCARQGRAVFLREGCGGCHRFHDLGGSVAPDLTDVGSRRSPDWINRQILAPARNNPATRMPSFPRLSWYERRSLIAFLLR